MYVFMAVVFVLGYLCIALEHPLKIDKAAAAILTAVFCWTVLVLGADSIISPQAAAHAPGGPAGRPRGRVCLFFSRAGWLGACMFISFAGAAGGGSCLDFFSRGRPGRNV